MKYTLKTEIVDSVTIFEVTPISDRPKLGRPLKQSLVEKDSLYSAD